MCMRIARFALFLLLATPAWADTPETRSIHFVTSDGTRLHYLDVGSGPAIVFVPGWMVPGWMWEPQIQYFAKNFRVLAMDPRSQGASERVNDGLYPERRAKDIQELLHHARTGRAVLVGHSMAVGELLTLVDRFGTGELAGLALVDAAIGPDPKPEDASQFFGFARGIAQDRKGFIEANEAMFFSKPPPSEYRRRLYEDVLSVPNGIGLALLLTGAGIDYRPMLSKLDVPVLYAITPHYRGDGETLLSSVPGARVEVFENAAHTLFIDEPEKFNRLLEEFARHAFARNTRE